jgi:uncharacterized protein YqfA (UPF0365 family)
VVWSTPFGLPVEPGSVEDEERVFGLHLFGLALRLRGSRFLMVPEVTAVRPADLGTGAAHDEHVLHRHMLAGGDVDRLVRILLERDRASSAQAFVCRDDEGRLAVHDTAGQRFRREAAEHH